MSGCSSLPQAKGPLRPSPGQVQKNKGQGVTLKEDQQPAKAEGTDEEIPVPTGMIFAKTDFQGIVKTSYVRLSIVDNAARSNTYQLYIGDKGRQKNFPWEVQTVKPGYFFIKLPVGVYRIDSISIPVSTTMAEEPMDITFEVGLDKVIYIGTLRVVGTKEKIKLGGVPLIKPGFEYTAELIDERKEALEEIRRRFPDRGRDVRIRLMHINRHGSAPR